MKLSSRLLLALTLTIACSIGPVSVGHSQTDSQPVPFKCDGKYAGIKVSKEELDEVLALHRQWLKDVGWEPDQYPTDFAKVSMAPK